MAELLPTSTGRAQLDALEQRHRRTSALLDEFAHGDAICSWAASTLDFLRTERADAERQLRSTRDGLQALMRQRDFMAQRARAASVEGGGESAEGGRARRLAFIDCAALSSICMSVSVYRKPLFTTTAEPIHPEKLKNQRTQNFQLAVEIALVR